MAYAFTRKNNYVVKFEQSLEKSTSVYHLYDVMRLYVGTAPTTRFDLDNTTGRNKPISMRCQTRGFDYDWFYGDIIIL